MASPFTELRDSAPQQTPQPRAAAIDPVPQPAASGRPGPRRRRFRPAVVGAGAVALTAAVMILGAGGPWPKPEAATQGVTVGAAGDTFGPAALTVTEGDTVTWSWVAGKHTVTSTNGSFDSGTLDAGASWSNTFTKAGTYSYVCIYHGGMSGSITVQPAPAAAGAPGTGTAGTTAASGSQPGAAGSATAPGAAGASGPAAGPTGSDAAAKPGAPKLTGVKVGDGEVRFTVSEPATVTAFAFRGRSAKSVRLGRVEAGPGPAKLGLRLDKLQPARYRLVVRASDTTGVRSAPVRRRFLLTRAAWQRAIDARRAHAKPAPAAAAPPAPAASAAVAAIPAAPPADATAGPPANAAAPAAPAPAATPAKEDHSGHGHGGSGTSGDDGESSGSNSSGSTPHGS